MAIENQKESNWTYFLGILFFIMAILLTLLITILLVEFKGELLFIAENLWIGILFIIFLLIDAFYTLNLTSRNHKQFKSNGIQLAKLDRNIIWNAVWAIINIAIGCILLYLAFYIQAIIEGLLGVSLAFLYGIIITIIIFAAIYPIISSVTWFAQLVSSIRKKDSEKPRNVRGMVAFGIIFLFLGSSLGIALFTMNSQFSPGVSVTPVFMANELYNGYPNGFGGQPPIKGYRIPSLLILPDNTILAFAEARENPWNDMGNNDLVMRISYDGGTTWSDMKVLVDDGTNTVGNPCGVYDKTTGIIHMLFNINNEQIFEITSADEGLTWSTPRNLTSALEIIPIPGVYHYTIGCGPGCGIQLTNGNLIIPSYFANASGAFVIYSNDHGSTWKLGGMTSYGDNSGQECQVVQGINGSLYLNIRSNGSPDRVICWSNDDGLTWNHAYSDPALPDVPCQASVCRLFTNVSTLENCILYAGPNDHVRGYYTIRLSTDEGQTWSYNKEIFSGPSAYGQLAIFPNGTIGLLFECGHYDYREGIQFVRFNLSWLINGS